jgi:hypothetical protein
MAKTQGHHQANCDGTIMGNCMLEGHHYATAHPGILFTAAGFGYFPPALRALGLGAPSGLL